MIPIYPQFITYEYKTIYNIYICAKTQIRKKYRGKYYLFICMEVSDNEIDAIKKLIISVKCAELNCKIQPNLKSNNFDGHSLFKLDKNQIDEEERIKKLYIK